ncbi:MAG: copper resistance protein CopC [Methylocystis sp.]|nr:copper resistance protein CopC [Methylocystis sp.]
MASVIGGAGGAQAHAFLDHASPPVGSTVGAAPSAVTLWFTQNLEQAFTSAEVLNAAGARVSGKARIDGANSLMQVGLKPLPPGTYTVRWRTLSVDTHTTEGSFTFQVGQ